VGEHVARPGDKEVPVSGAEPDRRPRKDHTGVEIEQPSDMVGGEMAADHVADVASGDAQGPQASKELAADQLHTAR
jgi:hypothetical protein